MNILITGANRGLGLAIAEAALGRGHAVIAGMRDPAAKSDGLAALAGRHGARLALAALDVTDEAGLSDLAARLKQAGTRLGAIVNNAAVLAARNTPIEALRMDEVAESFDINLFGPMRVAKHFLPLLTERDAALINISSEAGSVTHAYPGDYPYALSKAALNMFTRQLRAYVKDRGIAVLSVHPGWMKTDMGGPSAPGNPRDSASGILDMIERKIVPAAPFDFVDHAGKEMPI
ncbi:SDR family NAD(P)-dependent oxidoreductase [Paenibacillus sp. MWE-103]|uniref:SDR family NAD(P)-dependent oxidoreductase n=1 Tax=Paenibacillus artemisiicola TaxID=1172618 RepID=A0ABS3WC95_9BACL|nr:SDR family NAD(P)-dependent oxidoreductase [Paenibacillus artemisiicola]MBO7745935.1 SDR family NAD(P)-dependent oxidoreductase [Paenibacillus artemisiicola]